MKQLFFIAGLPRSGSTLLTNVLVQNPQVHCSPTSVLPQLLGDIKNSWHTLPLTRLLDEETSYCKLKHTLRGLVNGFYDDIEVPIIFDKSRAWPNLIETVLELGYEPKIIATVRKPEEIVASFENIYSRSLALGAPTQFLGNPQVMSNPDTRLDYWIGADSPFGSSFNALLDGVRRGHLARFHFVRFEDFTTYPAQELHNIYEFLDLKPFEHDVKNVVQTIFEDDRAHGFRDLHKIRDGAIQPVKGRAREMLPSQFIKKIEGQDFWNRLND